MTDIPADRRELRHARPTRWKRGDVITAAHLNETVDAVRAVYGVVQEPRQVMPDSATAAVFELAQFKVRATIVNGQATTTADVRVDYLACERLQGSPQNEGDDDFVRVALPYLLRRTPFDTGDDAPVAYGADRASISYDYSSNTARTATDDDDHSEDQVIVPSYVVGDVIYAVRGVGGGTGVLYTNTDGDRIDVEWLDLNVDGRAWGAA